MANEIAKVMFFGDDHLCSRNYGGHINYPEESLYYLSLITKLAKENKVTHLVGCGDLTYGRFTTLEYRLKVEKEFLEQREIVNGNIWRLKGNHDKASYGMTEYEYYLNKEFYNPGNTEIEIGNVRLNLKDWNNTEPVKQDGKRNIIVAHGYFKFKSSNVADYGEALVLDDYAPWFGVELIICGHIHFDIRLKGYIGNGKEARECYIHYLPCLSRPAYHKENTPKVGSVSFLHIFDDGNYTYEIKEIELLPIEKCFEAEAIKTGVARANPLKIDLTSVMSKLEDHEMNIGNPEDIIRSLKEIPEVYRNKAIELYKNAM